MRHVLLFLTVWMLGIGCAWCQNPNNPRNNIPEGYHPVEATGEDVVIGGTDDLRFDQSIPMEGNRTVNYLLGRSVYTEYYSRYFLEWESLWGGNGMALGMNFAYLPKRWGFYCSLLPLDISTSQYLTSWFTFGAALRPVTRPSSIDWHIYTGPAFGRGNGWEIGTRFAAANQQSQFSWFSGSIGTMYVGGRSYLTIGLSLLLSPSIGIDVW